MVKNGDRIKFIAHGDPDPQPLTPGEEGTVTHVSAEMTFPGERPTKQISVKWDSGRGLMLIHPIDRYELVKAADV